MRRREFIVRDPNSGERRDSTMVVYEVEQAFKALEGRTDVSDEDIAWTS
jgi:Mg-chelatase subunit ChlI